MDTRIWWDVSVDDKMAAKMVGPRDAASVLPIVRRAWPEARRIFLSSPGEQSLGWREVLDPPFEAEGRSLRTSEWFMDKVAYSMDNIASHGPECHKVIRWDARANMYRCDCGDVTYNLQAWLDSRRFSANSQDRH